MGDFVNDKKRSVSLPPGCKDLIDVLSRRPDRRLPEIAELLKALGSNSEAAKKILTSQNFPEQVNEEVKRLLAELEGK